MKTPPTAQRAPGDVPPATVDESPHEPTEAQDASQATEPSTDVAGKSLRAILIGLMVPMGMTILNMQMFSVALPAIRDSFGIDADTVALLVTAYMLPFVLFTPVYGQLGDSLGKRRLFSVGIIIFSAGTVICLFSDTLGQLFIGRVLQGMGTAGVNPLCIAIITDLFPPNDRGRALGTWSSTGPATSMVAPLAGGFLIDHWGWQSIFVPGLIAAGVALYVVRGRVPRLRPPRSPVFCGALTGLASFCSAASSSRSLSICRAGPSPAWIRCETGGCWRWRWPSSSHSVLAKTGRRIRLCRCTSTGTAALHAPPRWPASACF